MFIESAWEPRLFIPAHLAGERIVAHAVDDTLADLGEREIKELTRNAGGLSGGVDIEEAGEGIDPSDRIFHGRCVVDAVFTGDLKRSHALTKGDAAIADSLFVASDRVDHRGCAGKGLRFGRKILIVEDLLLEISVRAGVVLAAIEDDRQIRPADFAPVLDAPAVDLLDGFDVELFDRVFLGDVDSDRVDRDGRLDDLGAAILADGFDLALFDLAARVGEIGGAVDERGDASSTSAAGDLDGRVGVGGHEALGPALSEDHHRIGALDGERLPTAALLGALASRDFVVAIPARAQGEGDRGQEADEAKDS